MELMGDWNVRRHADPRPRTRSGLGADLGWFPFPAISGAAGDPKAALGGGDGFACSKNAPAECVEFLKYIVSPEVQKGYAAHQRRPARRQGRRGGRLRPGPADRSSRPPTSASYVQLWLDTAYGSTVGNAMNDAIVAIFAGTGTPEQVVDGHEVGRTEVTTTDPSRSLADRAPARSAGLRPTGTSSRAARTRRKWYEIIGLTDAGGRRLHDVRAGADGLRGLLQPLPVARVGPPTEFVGWRNYLLAFDDPIFLDALRNNAIILVGSLLVQGPIALGVALLLNRRFRGRALFRLLVFVPYVLAEVTVGIMWKLVLHAATARRTPCCSHSGWAAWCRVARRPADVVIWTMLFILTWKYVGFAIILFLAGLSNVPDELTEAAAIDGASWWQIQRHVTIPLLGPTIRIWMFLSMIGSLQVFDVIWVVSAPSVRSLGAVQHHGHLHGRQRLLRPAVGLRQRRRRDPVRHLVRRGAAVPALRSPP